MAGNLLAYFSYLSKEMSLVSYLFWGTRECKKNFEHNLRHEQASPKKLHIVLAREILRDSVSREAIRICDSSAI